jgi:hypothetical protein
VKSKSQERKPRTQTEADFVQKQKTGNKANRFFRINKTPWNKANHRTVASEEQKLENGSSKLEAKR